MGRLRRSKSGRALRLGLGLTGMAIGAGCLLAPARLARVAGVEPSPATNWLLRLFGARDLGLGYALLRTRQPQALRVLAEVMMIAQTLDLTASGLASRRGGLNRRALLGVWAGAVPTLVLSWSLRNQGSK